MQNCSAQIMKRISELTIVWQIKHKILRYPEKECLHVLHVQSDDRIRRTKVEVNAVVHNLVPLHRENGVDLAGARVPHSPLSVVEETGIRHVVPNVSSWTNK